LEHRRVQFWGEKSGRIRIWIQIHVREKGRIRIRIKVKRRIRIKEMRIRNTVVEMEEYTGNFLSKVSSEGMHIWLRRKIKVSYQSVYALPGQLFRRMGG
jgi:hypothetical protein